MQIPGKAIVVHSPYSGKSGQLHTALTQLRESGVEVVETMSIAELDHLPAQGTSWKQAGIEMAIAAGGDGLIGGVITHIAESGLILGILPLGTANDIARSLNIPQDIPHAVDVIADGTVQEIDIGVARPSEQAPHLASKDQQRPVLARVGAEKHGYFAHTVTLGLNVQFARIATNVATRKRYGRLTYPVAAIETLKYHDALDVTLQFEGLALPGSSTVTLTSGPIEPYRLHCKALQVTVINAPIFGGQWNLALPNVSLSDRLLDIVVIEEFELGRMSSAVARLFSGRSHDDEFDALETNEQQPTWEHHPANLTPVPGLYHMQARGVLISTNAEPRDVTLDGEVRGQTPIYVHVAEERLRVMAPAPERRED